MRRTINEILDERQIRYQLVFLGVMSILGSMLLAIIFIMKWNDIGLVVMSTMLVACWIVYLFTRWSLKAKLTFYVLNIMASMFYFVYHSPFLLDAPIILTIFIVLLAPMEQLWLIRLMIFSYILMVLENLFIVDFFTEMHDHLTIFRVVTGGIALVGVAMISRFMLNRMKELGESLHTVEDKLKESKKENELFLANVSHELRTPINAVSGVSEVLLAGDQAEEIRDKLEVIHSAGARLHRQVSNMLYFSEIQTDRFTLVKESYEVLSMVNDAVNICFGMNWESKVEVCIEIDSAIPRLLFGDPVKIRKLITSLMDNAIKYTKDGGIFLRLTYRREDYGINLLIEVTDTGCGIEEDQLEDIRRGVYRGNAGPEATGSGLGLGLAIAQGIVSAMNGFLQISRVETGGTKVLATIPQEVREMEHCITLPQHTKYKIVCYFNQEKYSQEIIGTRYVRFIENMKNSLQLDIIVAKSLEELKEICKNEKITHLFISDWEYEMDKTYFEALAGDMTVTVFTGSGYVPEEDSAISTLKKPIYTLSVVRHLKDTEPDMGQNAAKKRRREEEIDYRHIRALVVDDEPMNLIVAGGMLQNIGVQYDTASSGMDALEKCRISDYDIIFMDYMMPEMNGTAAMIRIREIRNCYYADKPIVVLTANAVSSAKEKFVKDGFDAFIAKPAEMKDFRKVLVRFCQKR